MAAKQIRGHALVKGLQHGDHFVWRCECGALYGAVTGDARITRESARERHRIHLGELAGPLTVGISPSEVGPKSAD
jgi:hypothetical protein